MPMPLEKWQERLEQHFKALASARAASGLPISALEHNLGERDLQEVSQLLHSRLAAGMRLSVHWLVWVVYATERGYDYDGEEYWRSFEKQTPNWENAGRSQLRDWFFKFAKRFKGVEPVGPWAECFTIIAWPVTHAILPKVLQLQFAKCLYDIRYSLASLNKLDAAEIGSLLAKNAWNASSRLRGFLQQEELAGRIVLALLSDKLRDGQGPIYTPTLQRIVTDLERVRRGREWLKETQRVVADRFKGAGRSFLSLEGKGSKETQSKDADERPRLRPRLLLKPSGAGTWTAIVEIPSFGNVAKLNPILRGALQTIRSRVAGTSENWMPGGWLLSGPQRRVLKEWPETNRSLVRLEQPNPVLDLLLESECRLTLGPVWLCLIGSDRLAREIAGRIARPGREYVVLSRRPLPPSPLITPCKIDCDNIHAGILALPNTVSVEDSELLRKSEIQVARTVRIWPAGLCGRNWDGEGGGEWLTTETPCFGIAHDHPVDFLVLRLNQETATVIEAGPAGVPTFVKLPRLPPGRHVLSVVPQRHGLSSTPAPANEGVITLDVREPEPWVPGTTLHTGLVVSFDPIDATLDVFWEGNVGVSILGPEGYSVTCSLSLTNSSGDDLLSEVIGTFELPITTADWKKKFARFISDEDRRWVYLEAAAGCLAIKGGELGEFMIRLERDIKPVRWVCRSMPRATILRLIDETGRDENAIAEFYSFERPALPVRLGIVSVLASFEAAVPGGLYVACHAERHDALIVSAPQVKRSFKGLVVEPDLRDLPSAPNDAILRLLDLWGNARLAGPLAELKRSRVICSLQKNLYRRVCGPKWADAEAALYLNPQSAAAVQQLERLVGGLPGFAATLRREYARIVLDRTSGTQWFTDVAARYQVSFEPALCSFALRLASEPQSLASAFGADLYMWIRRISSKPELLRGARLLSLLASAGSTTQR